MKKEMTPLLLSDLPKWSKWPARLLGLEAWSIPTRSLEKIADEYEKDKYSACLKHALTANDDTMSPEAILQYQQGENLRGTIPVSVADDLFTMPMGEALLYQDSVRLEALSDVVEKAEVVIELGCGYGYNLWMLQRQFPDKLYIGGEYSRSAVKLASVLFQKNAKIKVDEFNFYDQKYDLLNHCKSAKVVVFTAHAIEQLPSAKHTLNVLTSYRSIQGFIHFEPIHELYDDSLLGLMRRRYTEVNDYNRDLLTCLQSHSEIDLLETSPHAFGINPIHPTSIIRWKFK